MVRERIYFAGQLVGTVDGDGYWSLPGTDRLGSLKHGSRRYPFGDGNESYANGEYATYRKDTASAHYYAWHRYYSATWGRFSSPDPYVMSGGLTNPQGWNRYSYVANDPVNFYDPTGLFPCGSSFRTTPYGWSVTVFDCVSRGGNGERDRNLGAFWIVDDGDIRPYTDPCAEMIWCSMHPGEVALGGATLDALQESLNIIGFAPGPLGAVADAANVLISFIRGDMVNAGYSLLGVLPFGSEAAFTMRTFRKGVLQRLGVSEALAVNKHAHHVLPRQHAERFARLGLDVNDPRFGVLLDGEVQLHNALKYNARWAEWLDRNQYATADDVLRFAEELAREYGFPFRP